MSTLPFIAPLRLAFRRCGPAFLDTLQGFICRSLHEHQQLSCIDHYWFLSVVCGPTYPHRPCVGAYLIISRLWEPRQLGILHVMGPAAGSGRHMWRPLGA